MAARPATAETTATTDPPPGEWANTLTFALNGHKVELTNPDPQLKLVTLLRDERLTGTKLACGEGGCGACTVVLSHRPLSCSITHNSNITKPTLVHRAVNACLFPVCALDGIAVTTIEGVGSTANGLHDVQQRLADANGTQCGFCTPGWVMNMYELLQRYDVTAAGTDTNSSSSATKLTRRVVEDHFDGNLCRCTGYRPIFEAFHSFASDRDVTADTSCEHLDDWLLVDAAAASDGGIVAGRTSICSGTCGKAATCSTYMDLEDLIPRFRPLTDTDSDSSIKSANSVSNHCAAPVPDFIVHFEPRALKLAAASSIWYRPLSLAQLFAALDDCGSHAPADDVAFVGGRTAHGVSKYYNNTAPYYRPDEARVQIELTYVAELQTLAVHDDAGFATVGAAVTLNALLQFLQTYDVDNNDIGISTNNALRELATLVGRVANNQVRNAGTWAGNLSLCRQYPAFVSDVAVGLMGIGATLTLVTDTQELREHVGIDEYLRLSHTEFALIVSMHLPLFSIAGTNIDIDTSNTPTNIDIDTSNTPTNIDIGINSINNIRANDNDVSAHHHEVFRCYKVAQRVQNAHAHVNSAVWLQLRTDATPPIITAARVVFGGVCAHPARFPLTETLLVGRSVDAATATAAMAELEHDVDAIGASSAFGSQSFRVATMQNLLYKTLVLAVIDISPSALLDPTVATAPNRLERAISSGTQAFKPSDALSPVSQPVQKLGAKWQVSGEATYVSDTELPARALFGTILYSRKALGKLLVIDETGAARALPGVVDIVTAADILGVNDVSDGSAVATDLEPLFVPLGGIVRCVGAPLALIVATSQEVAEQAVALCRIVYGAVPLADRWQHQTEPIVGIDMAMRAGTKAPTHPITMGDADVTKALAASPRRLHGALLLGAQKHLYMEPQVASANISVDGGSVVTIDSSSQFPSFVQLIVARVLGVAHHKVVVRVPRVGGGFGGKLTRCAINAAAAAVAATKHRRAVRVLNDRGADFQLVGGREPMKGTYDIGFDTDGRVLGLDLTLHVDCGYAVWDSIGNATMAVNWSDSAYRVPSFRCQAVLYRTNTQSCTSHRAPGVPQALALVEAAMHHVATELELPLSWVQERNLYRDGDVTPLGQTLTDVKLREVWDRVLTTSQFAERDARIARFNANNKWKKRAVATTPTKYGMTYSGRRDGSKVAIFAADGSVAITHGGCEIGQGIHTKAAQACAYVLGIPLALVAVRATSTDKTPNSEATGGSSTSESVVQSILACCAELKALMKPIDDAHPGEPWAARVALAHDAGIRLFAVAQPFSVLAPPAQFDYYVYAAACAEVELDVLTGEVNVLQCDIVYDCGLSLNPAIDIGQIEGAFVMGIGLYLQEDVVYDPASGALLSQGTWEYKVPCSKDIPETLKVTLLENAAAQHGVLGSKATGEPPYALATSVLLAVKHALAASRVERGQPAFFQLDVPATVARRQEAANIQSSDFTL